MKRTWKICGERQKRRNSLIVEILAGKRVQRVMIDSCGKTYEDLLLTLKINPETVVVLAESGPVPLDEEVCGEKVTIIRVVSSG